MSKAEMQKGYGGNDGPTNGYPYGDERVESSRAAQPKPMLPPMSSLLRPEEERPLVRQQYPNNPYVASQFQPSYNVAKLAAWPTSPTEVETSPQPYYSPPRPMSPDNTTEDQYSLPIQPSFFPRTTSLMNSEQPLAQRRQIKKITQRKTDYTKERQHQDPRNQVGYQPNLRNSTPGSQPLYESRTQPCAAPLKQESSPYRRRESIPQNIRRESVTDDRSATLQRQMSNGKSPRGQQPYGQPSRSVPISGLLSSGPSPTIHNPPSPQYSIHMRQQPLAARACGFGERDRRVIDPPPILQMTVACPNSTPAELSSLLRQPFAVVHCTLWDPQSDTDDTAMPSSTSTRQQRRLMGTLVASPFVGNDEFNVEGCFFCFPDLSVRTPGTYSLKFSLVKLDPSRMGPGMSEPVRSTVMSSVFHVYNAKDFGGMRASTELTKSLKHQGCLISVKKGNAKSNKNREDDDDGDDGSDDDDAGDGGKGKRVKR